MTTRDKSKGHGHQHEHSGSGCKQLGETCKITTDERALVSSPRVGGCSSNDK
jgi:hypothetical protein